ncbi:MAG: DNA polymerase I [Pseudomonadota bacterium]|nr:DNA polymerase I [Pseudomonadota bacterium]
MAKVCLIDGSGYIFRAFYALPAMTAPDGTPVNAVYGFLTMFMRLIKAIPCDYCVVLFDAKRKNFRNAYFADYKATRAEIPELLIPQFELIYKTVEKLNLPCILQEGYEADDLIATYARQAVEAGHDAVVVSADKDLMQLIRPHVEFYDGMKDKFFTPEEVKEKFGVYPDKVVDVQALSGDKIDNIPGIPGIGPKTAAELVNMFGSLQGVLDNADKIKQNKRREIVLQNKESAELSLKLVTLKDDVPVKQPLEAFKCQAPDADTLLDFVSGLGFKSILPKLQKWVEERCCALGGISPKIKAEEPVYYAKVQNREDLQNLYRQILSARQMSFQVLHNGMEPEALSISTAKNSAYYLPIPQIVGGADLFSHEEVAQLSNEAVKKFLLSVLENKNVLKIALGLKSQWHDLNKICGRQLDLWPYDDVAVMSYDADSSMHEHTLPVLSEMFLDKKINEPKLSQKVKKIDFFAPEYDDYIFKAADFVLQLRDILKNILFHEHKMYVYEMLDRRLIQVLMQMEDEGITIDESCMAELNDEFSRQMNRTESEIFALAGTTFNLSSPKQIGEVLFDKLGFSGAKKTAGTGNYNTSAEVLEQLAEEHEIAAKILEWRSYAKLKSTYTTALLEVKDRNNRVHTTFSQTVVNTGRLASSNPNLQNIPNRSEIGRKIRACFVARKGYKIVAADYSQMELRLLASVADVKALKEAFAAGVDIHAATAARVFGLKPEEVDRDHRSRAKAINFGIVYGISQFGLAKQINTTREIAKQYIDSYFAAMPEVKVYMEKTIEFARRHGYVLTPLGRKCAVLGINDKNHRIVSFAERAAINAPIQGGAADIVKLAMQKVFQAMRKHRLEGHLLLQVHDELVLEVKEEHAAQTAALLQKIMEETADTAVKMVVETGIGATWADAH